MTFNNKDDLIYSPEGQLALKEAIANLGINLPNDKLIDYKYLIGRLNYHGFVIKQESELLDLLRIQKCVYNTRKREVKGYFISVVNVAVRGNENEMISVTKAWVKDMNGNTSLVSPDNIKFVQWRE